jgi:EAL domain-containing protein (putative c-di-GMP-specific phosphodiesterase class I)
VLETTTGRPLEIAVNISAAGLRAPQFVPRIGKLLRPGVLAPGQLSIEISEKDIDSDLHLLRPVFEELRELEVGLALDDFGVGNSSFARLRDLPFTKLKIDRAFVTKLLEKPIDMAIVRAVVELGRSLDLPVVAEGVEDAATAELLVDIGCAQAQGYHFARPGSLDTLLESGLVTTLSRHATGDAA